MAVAAPAVAETETPPPPTRKLSAGTLTTMDRLYKWQKGQETRRRPGIVCGEEEEEVEEKGRSTRRALSLLVAINQSSLLRHLLLPAPSNIARVFFGTAGPFGLRGAQR